MPATSTQWFKQEETYLLLGKPVDTEDPGAWGDRAYLQLTHQLKTGLPPRCDLDAEKQLHDALRGWMAQGIIQSAHDCSEGGLAVTLAECCISGEEARHTPHLMGASIQLEKPEGLRLDALLFGESQARIVVSIPPNFEGKLLGQAKILGISAQVIGTVGGETLSVHAGDQHFSWTTQSMHDTWFHSIDRIMGA